MSRRSRSWAACIAVAASLSVAGCGDAELTFGARDAWARPTPDGAPNGVVYLTITTDVADLLVAAQAPTTIAAATELHATTTSASTGGGHVHGGGGNETMEMEHLDNLVLPPRTKTVLAPGGNHVMLVGLTRGLERGQSFELTLVFRSGRNLTVPVVVADNPPG